MQDIYVQSYLHVCLDSNNRSHLDYSLSLPSYPENVSKFSFAAVYSVFTNNMSVYSERAALKHIYAQAG